jgi:hypothetical protein
MGKAARKKAKKTAKKAAPASLRDGAPFQLRDTSDASASFETVKYCSPFETRR